MDMKYGIAALAFIGIVVFKLHERNHNFFKPIFNVMFFNFT